MPPLSMSPERPIERDHEEVEQREYDQRLGSTLLRLEGLFDHTLKWVDNRAQVGHSERASYVADGKRMEAEVSGRHDWTLTTGSYALQLTINEAGSSSRQDVVRVVIGGYLKRRSILSSTILLPPNHEGLAYAYDSLSVAQKMNYLDNIGETLDLVQEANRKTKARVLPIPRDPHEIGPQ